MSYHEILWWHAYSSLRPLNPVRQDIVESRIVGALCGQSADKVFINWFDPEKDDDYRKMQADTALNKIRAYRAKKEAKNGKTN